MIVEVRPREGYKWHGKKADMNFSRPKVVVAAVDPDTMKYKVVFTEDELAKLKATNFDLSLEYVPEKPHPTWDGPVGKVKLEPNTMLFDTSVVTDLIKVGVIRGANKHVAPSLEAAENDGEFSSATHFIYSEEVEMADKVAKIAIKQEANSLLYQMTPEKIRNILILATGKNFSGKSDDFTRATADELINKEPSTFLKWAKMNPESLMMASLVEEAIQEGIFVREAGGITWQGSRIGFDRDEVIDYVNKPENQILKAKVLDLLDKGKKKKK